MTSMLQQTVETGTAYGASLLPRVAGGKTGTSQDYRDAWFMGFTEQLTTGIWMGNDNNSPMNEVTGGLLPADVWKDYMVAAHKGLPRKDLPLPEIETDESKASEIMMFYSGLAAALRQERDLASGSGARITTAGR
jgi:penicillin-binding protein 1A